MFVEEHAVMECYHVCMLIGCIGRYIVGWMDGYLSRTMDVRA